MTESTTHTAPPEEGQPINLAMPTPSAEEIARHYDAAMDSVRLLFAGKPMYVSESDWPDCIKRNVEHLEIMLNQPWWDGYDLAPFQQAINAHK
jgi:hypothetical protein